MAVGLTAALVLSACGDDDDTDEGASGGDDVAAYCEAVAVVDATDDVTVEQIEAIRDAAPEEIREAIDVVADRFVEGIEAGDIESVFEDEEVNAALTDVVEPFEDENCPEEEGEDAVAPEFAEYCEQSAALDEQDDLPTEQQLRDLQAVAPEAIAAEIAVVAEAFIAQGEGAFADPAVNEAFGPIEDFDAEECGIDDDTADLSTDEDASAAQVAVTAVDYDFQFDAPAAGVSTFTMTNQGTQPHFMYVVQLAEGVTLDQAMAADGEDGTVVADADSATAVPGDQASLTVDLPAGEYAMLCFVETDGVPHAELGMAVPFTVE